MRTGRWKYGVDAPDKSGGEDACSDRYVEQYLYDLEADPEERHNLLGEFVTTTEVGHVETRVLGGRTPLEQSFLGTGTDDEALRALFYRLWQRLDELIEETGAAAEPNWRP